jgi:hypothetical protein
LKRITTFAQLFFLLSFVCTAQEQTHSLNSETKAEVPALKDFHSVVYTLWHTAWPEKDIALLSTLADDIEKGADAIAKAELPGILRDKKADWDERTSQLTKIVAEYKNAIQTKDDEALLAAAEKLHSQYEKLVRLIRPPLPEIDSFHTALYPLYHYYLPEYDIEKIRKSVSALEERMEMLNKTSLPERRKNLTQVFTEKRSVLAASVTALRPALNTNKKETIQAAIEKMHQDYQSLEKVFE